MSLDRSRILGGNELTDLSILPEHLITIDHSEEDWHHLGWLEHHAHFHGLISPDSWPRKVRGVWLS